ncbi:MAG: helix-turn-helix domain-containing protein [Methylotenera sp.]|jgi:DNA-binding transcriptional ArsR family regulator|uniref:ArsR/SmtB family transcription factor n=1 Tax=Methylotenera sp. TaxID=2051956 RepID=UPI00271B5058|nr:helix-turn-helix domain-containing protein [Methylotenera sp.]MDO9151681.1 helix-turn-helix domain-containing protein [Methylotenera sp.]
MDKNTATSIFESLSSGVRLDVFRLLVKQGLNGMVAGEIATTLNIPANNLSFHLKAMIYANMVSVEQEGRYQRYRANISLMLDVIAYLTEECCAGHPEKCVEMRTGSVCLSSVLPSITTDKSKV